MNESQLGAAQPLALQRAAPPPSCEAQTRDRLQSTRKRAVVECWILATAPQQRSVMLAQFEPRGDSALAVVVLDLGQPLAFLDFPAKLNEAGDTWRVGDGGKLSPEGFEIMFWLEGSVPYAVGIAWAAEEGQSLKFAVPDGSGNLTAVVQAYRYWSPQ